MKSYAEEGIIPSVGDDVFVLAKRSSLLTAQGRERRNPHGIVGTVKAVSDGIPPKVLVTVPVPADMRAVFGRDTTSEWRTTDRIGVLR